VTYLGISPLGDVGIDGRGLSIPEHEGEGQDTKVRKMREGQQSITMTAPHVSHQCAPEGLFIGVITHGHYNGCNAPIHLP
jgi:hypothetical protein